MVTKEEENDFFGASDRAKCEERIAKKKKRTLGRISGIEMFVHDLNYCV